MISTSDAYANVVAETRHWLTQDVIGLNLCPFAKAVQVKDQIRFAVSDATDAEGVLTDLQDELALLAEADPEKIDTTLLIVPDALDDFLDFNDFEDLSDRLLKRMRMVGELQVATFHPQFQFADTQRTTSRTTPTVRRTPSCTCCAKTASTARSSRSPTPPRSTRRTSTR